MKHMRYLTLFLLISISAIALINTTGGIPASDFSQRDGEWYDNWAINRNNAGINGELPGYLPNLASETLGENKEKAYSIGERFLTQYQSKNARADAILKFVQTWTYYGYDSDNFVRDGVAQDEWAQNADEFAEAFNENTGVKAVGDCEDMAFLCGTIYVAAGFDAAIIDATDHAALLIWLPEYPNADEYWDINDGRGAGWIWVEATGSENPVGWTPSDYEDGDWTAYQINSQPYIARSPTPSEPTLDVLDLLLLVIAVIILLLRRILS